MTIDRSAMVQAGVPYLWGPGPWDFDGLTWINHAYQASDLRAWEPGIEPAGNRIVTRSSNAPFGERIDGRRGGRRRDDRADMLPAVCWCGRGILSVPTAVVRACRTQSCGRPRCTEPAPRRHPQAAAQVLRPLAPVRATVLALADRLGLSATDLDRLAAALRVEAGQRRRSGGRS